MTRTDEIWMRAHDLAQAPPDTITHNGISHLAADGQPELHARMRCRREEKHDVVATKTPAAALQANEIPTRTKNGDFAESPACRGNNHGCARHTRAPSEP